MIWAQMCFEQPLAVWY